MVMSSSAPPYKYRRCGSRDDTIAHSSPPFTSIFQRKETTAMQIKTNVKAGVDGPVCPEWGCGMNHNQTVAHGLRVKSNMKAGAMQMQHNQIAARGLKVK